MADHISDPRFESLLRDALTAEVARLPLTVRPDRILERGAARRTARARSRLRILISGQADGGLRMLSITVAAAALFLMTAVVVVSLPRTLQSPAAPLPATPDAWTRVWLDTVPGSVDAIAVGPSGLLTVVSSAEDGAPARLSVSTDGLVWADVPSDRYPVFDASSATVIGTDRGFLMALENEVWSSTDGYDWQRVADSMSDWDLSQGTVKAIAAGGLGYVAVGSDNQAWYSTDGSDWSLAEVPPRPTEFFRSQGFGAPSVEMDAIAASGDTLVASGTASFQAEDSGLTLPVVWVSRDGRSWRSVLDPTSVRDPGVRDALGPLAAGPGGYVAVDVVNGGVPGLGDVVVRTSEDGDVWEQVGILGPWFSDRSNRLDVTSIAASGGGFVAVGARSVVCLMAGVPCGPVEAVIWTSPDGRAWSRQQGDDRFASPDRVAHAGAGAIAAWGASFVVGGTDDDKPVIWISGDETPQEVAP